MATQNSHKPELNPHHPILYSAVSRVTFCGVWVLVFCGRCNQHQMLEHWINAHSRRSWGMNSPVDKSFVKRRISLFSDNSNMSRIRPSKWHVAGLSSIVSIVWYCIYAPNFQARDICFFIFTNPSARPGYDTRSVFKRSLTGLNSEFSLS